MTKRAASGAINMIITIILIMRAMEKSLTFVISALILPKSWSLNMLDPMKRSGPLISLKRHRMLSRSTLSSS